MFAVNIMIVEDEPLIAISIEQIVRAAGASSAVLLASLDEAQRSADRWPEFGLAFIPPPRNAEELAIARAIIAAGIVVVVVTTNSTHSGGVEGLERAPVVVKPFSETDLLAACENAILLSQIRDVR